MNDSKALRFMDRLRREIGMVSIVIPTYREAENINVLICRIAEILDPLNQQYEIIVVDDDSCDGIADVVRSLEGRYPVVLKIRKNERGLSSAVIEGIGMSRGEIVLVMDADLSHPPEKLPELIEPIARGEAQFVIGSRFVKGGSAPHFNLYRKLNAWVSRMLARPITRVKDPMAGFFAFEKNLLNGDVELNPVGFKIGLEILIKAGPKEIREIPISFQERLYGESKLSLKEQVKYLIHLRRLFEHKYQALAEFIKFSLIGASGMVVDLTVVFAAYDLIHLPFRIARVIGFVFALTTNFLLNRKFTFRDARKGNVFRQYFLFFAVCLVGFAVNWLVSVYLFEHVDFFHTYYLLSAFIGILGGMLVNFTGSKLIVFKSR